MPDPIDALRLDLNKVTAEERSEIQEILDQFESPFALSQKRRREAMLSDKLKQARGDASGAYKFDYSESADLQEKLGLGALSKKEEAQIKQLVEEGSDVNLGYAFLTFSHADEARMFLLDN